MSSEVAGAGGQIELRIPDVPLGQKLGLVGACLQAIREAHRPPIMSNASWSEINEAESRIAAAILALEADRQDQFAARWNAPHRTRKIENA